MRDLQHEAKAKIRGLIQKFERERALGTLDQYNEAEAKVGFIEPFLQALGWNTQDRNEVALEEKVSGGRVDYALKIRGSPQVYVEAKPPRADLTKPEIVLQAITYGYSKGTVKWVLLTDFEQLRLFDVTIKPSPRNLERGLRLDLNYNQYLERFDDLWLLSRPSVEHGDLDRALLSKKLERERVPVDKAFLADLERWRELLAKNLYKRSDFSLDADRLREATQRILDRIIFIRSCEDRKLTHTESLRDLVLERRDDIGTEFMLVLKNLFRRYDRDFNSDLFAPHFSEDLAVDFTVLKEIILETYEPYLFDAIGVELLGSIYEQYLGYTINLTEKRVKYELKPEVKKAGGVYYTPASIVEYIVKNTVGRLLRSKGQRAGGKEKPLRILDPACGSGSFLIRAYESVANHYEALKAEALREKAEALKKARLEQFAFPLVTEGEEPSPRLTIFEKRQIVLNHLFGVDIDPQACEVARLSLMLKMLEDEYGIVPGRAVLPALDYNIQCGNSLISGDVLNLQSFFKEDWIKTKPFDWEIHFRTIMEEGGFDAIIGNPPYVRIQTLPRDQVAFFNQHYASATGNYDIYVLFVERALQLLKPGGILGLILPHKFFQAAYGKGLRKLIADQKCLMEIVNFRDNQIFEGSSTYTCLLFLQKDGAKSFKYTEIAKLANPGEQLQTIFSKEEYQDQNMRIGRIPRSQATTGAWAFSFSEHTAIIEKLKTERVRLADISEKIFQGLITGCDPVFILEKRGIHRTGKTLTVYSKATDRTYELEAGILKPLLKGSLDIKRYAIIEPDRWVIFPYRITQDDATLIPPKELAENYPRCWEYLKENKKRLESREHGRWRGPHWYTFSRIQNLTQFDRLKILTPSIAKNASFACDMEGKYYFVGSGGGGGGGYGIILKPDVKIHPYYVTALLNSKLLDFYLKKISTPFRSGFYAYNRQYIEQIPIRLIDFNNPAEKKLHDDLVALVDVILALHQQLQQAVGAEREQLQHQIEKTDREIDERVYNLYGITDAELVLVEAKS